MIIVHPLNFHSTKVLLAVSYGAVIHLIKRMIKKVTEKKEKKKSWIKL